MYPCRGVLHTPYKCPHSGQTDRPIWSDSPMCLFVLTPSIHELFTPSNYRSPSGSFVGRMQYATILSDEKIGCQNAFVMLFEAQNWIKMFLWYFLRLKMEFKCFCSAFWASKSSQNVFDVFFEAQNGVQMFLQCFLRLKIESKCFWCVFWGSKSNQNAFDVLFEAQNWVKMFLRCFLILKIESKCFWGTFWGSKWSESIFWGLSFAQYSR